MRITPKGEASYSIPTVVSCTEIIKNDENLITWLQSYTDDKIRSIHISIRNLDSEATPIVLNVASGNYHINDVSYYFGTKGKKISLVKKDENLNSAR